MQLVATDPPGVGVQVRDLLLSRWGTEESQGPKQALLASDVRTAVAWQWPGAVLDDHQWRIVEAVFDPTIREVFVKGAAKTGKGAAAAIAVCLWYWLWPDARVVITSSSHEHASKDVMFPEVAGWYAKMREAGTGKLLKTSVEDFAKREHTVKVANPLSDEGFSGRHGPHVLFVFDESSALDTSRYHLSRTQAAKLIALSNPRTTSGWFYEAYHGYGVLEPDKDQLVEMPYGKRALFTVSGEQCVNVREKRVVIPGQLDYDLWRAHCDPAANEPWWIDCFAHGRFPTADPSKQVIFPHWLPRHLQALRPDLPVEAFGLDVARSEGGDATVLACGGREGCRELAAWQERDSMRTVGLVLRRAEQLGVDLKAGRNPICVDADGLGGPVADALRAAGCWVVFHEGGRTAEDSHRYANTRAESYWGAGAAAGPGWAARRPAVGTARQLDAARGAGEDASRRWL